VKSSADERRPFPQLNAPPQMALSEVRSNGLVLVIGGCSLLVAMGRKLTLPYEASKSAILPTDIKESDDGAEICQNDSHFFSPEG